MGHSMVRNMKQQHLPSGTRSMQSTGSSELTWKEGSQNIEDPEHLNEDEVLSIRSVYRNMLYTEKDHCANPPCCGKANSMPSAVPQTTSEKIIVLAMYKYSTIG